MLYRLPLFLVPTLLLTACEPGTSNEADDSAGGDSDSVPLQDAHYTADFQSHFEWSGTENGNADCDGTVELDGDARDRTIGGDGTCTLDTETVAIHVTGTADVGSVEGTITLTTTDDVYEIAFTGTGSVGNPLAATFSATFDDGSTALSIRGDWTADPT